jgi:ketosteroid isomerase-like protein
MPLMARLSVRTSSIAPFLTVLTPLAFVVTLVACQNGEVRPPPSADTARATAPDPTTAVRVAADSIIAAFGRQDSASYFSHFAPEASFTFHTTVRRLNTRAEYEAEWQSWKPAGFRVRSCSSSDQRVQLFGDIAILTHSVRTEVTTREGDSTLLERESIVFQRRNGAWIAIHEHLSPLPRT